MGQQVVRKCAREGCENEVVGRNGKKWCSLSCYYNCQQYRDHMRLYMKQYRKNPEYKTGQRAYRQSEEYRDRDRKRHCSPEYIRNRQLAVVDKLMISYGELAYIINWTKKEKDPITLLYLGDVLQTAIDRYRHLVDLVVINSVIEFPTTRSQ